MSSLSQSFSSSDALEIFLYVRNNFVFEPYYGYMKGAEETLNSGMGNDFDQCALLVNLLRRAKIQARYVEGKITLSLSELANWFRVETATAVQKLLNLCGFSYQSRSEGGQSTFTFSHVWVEAYVGGSWIRMDPSFKQYRRRESLVAHPDESFSTGEAESKAMGRYGVTGIDTASILRAVEYYTGISSRLKDLMDVDSFLEPEIVPVQGYSAPVQLAAENVYEEIPASRTFYVELTLPSFDPSTRRFNFARNASGSHPTPLLSDSRISLYFMPVDESTVQYVQSFQRAFLDEGFDPDKVMMYPMLKFNSTRMIVGGPMLFGYFMPLNVRFRLGNRLFYEGRVNLQAQVGTWNSVVIRAGLHRLRDGILLNRLKELNKTLSLLGKQDIYVDDMLGALYDAQGRLTFSLNDYFSLGLQEGLNVRVVGRFDVALVGFRLDVFWRTQTRRGFTYSGAFIDWRRFGNSGALSATNDESSEMVYNLLAGSITSHLEAQVIRFLYGIPAVSTSTVLEAASEQGVPIFIVGRANWDEVSRQLSLSKIMIDRLEQDVDRGSLVIVPQRMIAVPAMMFMVSRNGTLPEATTWTGTAWITVNPSSFLTEWWIQAAVSSGSGDAATESVNPLPLMGGSSDQTVLAKFQIGVRLAQILTTQTVSQAIGLPILASLAPAIGWAALIAGILSLLSPLANYVGQKMGEGVIRDPFNAARDWMRVAHLSLMWTFERERVRFDPISGWQVKSPPRFAPSSRVALAEAGSTSQQKLLPILLDIVLDAQYTVRCGMQGGMLLSLGSLKGGSFSAYLEDLEGHRTGFAVDSALVDLDYPLPYLLDADSFTWGLYNPRAGSYSVVLSGSADRSVELVLAYGTYQGSRSNTNSRKVTIPRGGSVIAPLHASFDSKGVIGIKLGDFEPSIFAAFDNVDGASIRGRLFDAQRAPIAGQKVNLYYRPSLNFSLDWTPIGSAETTANGTFVLDWRPPIGASTLMVTCNGRPVGFGSVDIPFKVRLSVLDIDGKPLSTGEAKVIANNKTAVYPIHEGLVTFDAFSGYNKIEVDGGRTAAILFIPLPTQSAITLRTNVPSRPAVETSQVLGIGRTELILYVVVALAAIVGVWLFFRVRLKRARVFL